MRAPTTILLVFCIGSTSCAVKYDKAFVEAHLISVDAEGEAVRPVERTALKKKYVDYIQNILCKADEASDKEGLCGCMVDKCPRESERHPGGSCARVRRILVYVHGGLNTSDSSLETSDQLAKDILAEGNHETREHDKPSDWHYPIFVTWPSGFFETYAEHLGQLRQGRHSRLLGYPSSPYYFVRDVASGVVNAPQSLMYQGTTDTALGLKVLLGSDILPSSRNATKIYQAIGPKEPRPGEHPERMEFPIDLKIHLGDYQRGGVAQTLRFLRYWTLFPLKVLNMCLFVDGMGTASWQVMLHRAHNLFRPAKEFETVYSSHSLGTIRDDDVNTAPSGAFAEFLRELDKHIEAEEECDRNLCYQITLVGHSLGAIILNRALEHFPRLPVTRIVYMAPACTIRDVEQSIVPLLKPTGRMVSPPFFHVLTLHPLAEADEIEAYDVVPRGSLLEWIDSFFTTPTAHGERRFGKWSNLIQALQIFMDVQKQVTIKGFGVDGDSLPQKHGDFNQCPFWRRSFWDPENKELYYRSARILEARVPEGKGPRRNN